MAFGQSCADFRRIRVVSQVFSVDLSIRACVCVSVRSTVSVCVRALGGSFGGKSYIKAHPLRLLGGRVVPEGNKNTGLHSVSGPYRAVGSHHAGWILLRRLRYTLKFLARRRWELWPQRSVVVVVGGGIPVAGSVN